MSFLDQLGPIASAATALGVGFGAFQLWLTHRQAITAFEDSLAKEYRDLAARLPTEALLGEALSDPEMAKARDEFFRYFDLTNGQAFLRQIGRVSRRTWTFWADGMRSHMAKPAFKSAWGDISARARGDFDELRRLVKEDFRKDPRRWN